MSVGMSLVFNKSVDLIESPMFKRLPERGKSPKTSSKVVARKRAEWRTSPCKRVESAVGDLVDLVVQLRDNASTKPTASTSG